MAVLGTEVELGSLAQSKTAKDFAAAAVNIWRPDLKKEDLTDALDDKLLVGWPLCTWLAGATAACMMCLTALLVCWFTLLTGLPTSWFQHRVSVPARRECALHTCTAMPCDAAACIRFTSVLRRSSRSCPCTKSTRHLQLQLHSPCNGRGSICAITKLLHCVVKLTNVNLLQMFW